MSKKPIVQPEVRVNDKLTIYLVGSKIIGGGNTTHLTRAQMGALILLVNARGETVSIEEFIAAFPKQVLTPKREAVWVLMQRLKQKLDEVGLPGRIIASPSKTRPGVKRGYRLNLS